MKINRWKLEDDVSFWGKRPIFSGEMAFSVMECSLPHNKSFELWVTVARYFFIIEFVMIRRELS